MAESVSVAAAALWAVHGSSWLSGAEGSVYGPEGGMCSVPRHLTQDVMVLGCPYRLMCCRNPGAVLMCSRITSTLLSFYWVLVICCLWRRLCQCISVYIHKHLYVHVSLTNCVVGNWFTSPMLLISRTHCHKDWGWELRHSWNNYTVVAKSQLCVCWGWRRSRTLLS